MNINIDDFDDEIVRYHSKKKKPKKKKANHKHDYSVMVVFKEYYNHRQNFMYFFAHKCSICDKFTYDVPFWKTFGHRNRFNNDEEILEKFPGIQIIEKDL